MKKISLKNKLSLNKETVAKLNKDQLNAVQGGSQSIHSCITACYTTCVGVNCFGTQPTIVGNTCMCGETTPEFAC